MNQIEYKAKDLPHKPIFLRCRACGELKIPWLTNTLGCPPDVCIDCRKGCDSHKSWEA